MTKSRKSLEFFSRLKQKIWATFKLLFISFFLNTNGQEKKEKIRAQYIKKQVKNQAQLTKTIVKCDFPRLRGLSFNMFETNNKCCGKLYTFCIDRNL